MPAGFLGLDKGETIARTTVVPTLKKYITEKGLNNKVKKNEINPARTKLLSPAEDFGAVPFFNFCKLLSLHFPASKKALTLKENEEKTGGAFSEANLFAQKNAK